MAKAIFAAVAFLALNASLATRSVSLKERPVMKVVRMLQDMKVELQKELDDDKAVHEMLGCWCSTNEKDKTQAIELAQAKIEQLKSTMDEATAKMIELKTKRKATLEEVDADNAALGKSTALRMKENQAFHGEETDQLEAIAACKQAVVVLSKHNPQLAQVRAAARQLQNSGVSQLVLVSGALRRSQLEALKGFLSEAQTASSFLAIPGFKSYAPQSSQIFGILQQMQEDFESRLSEAQKTELTAKKQFDALRSAKQEEIKAGQDAIVQMDADLAEFGEKHAAAAQEHEDTENQLGMDQEFLANLQKKCSESGAEYDQRVKDRLEEIQAVDETISILNSDGSFDAFDKSVNTAFIQTSQTRREQQNRRQRAVSVLQAAALRTGAPELAQVASRAQLDAFTKVKEEIDKLVAELGKQQQDEVAHRDECTGDFNANERSTAAGDDKQASLQTKIADLESEIKTLTADIKASYAAVSEMQKQMKRAGETRESENKDFAEMIADQRLTQAILDKALARMKQVYALMQQPGAPHIQTSGTHTDPGNGPARFTKYETSAGGGRVVAAIQTILDDSKKMADEAIAGEQDAQAAYESFMKGSNKSITQHTQQIVNMDSNKAKAKESLSMANTDLKQTMQELEGLNDVKGDLHKSCDFILNNFDARQEARSAEVEALREAKAILSGMQ